MCKHLNVFVLAQVKVIILIDSPALVCRKSLDGDVERLFIVFGKLALCAVNDRRDARRQDVVDGSFSVVLLNVDGGDIQCSLGGLVGSAIE